MKLHTRFLAVLLFSFMSLSSCENLFEEIMEENMVLEVTTQQPEINQTSVTFYGTLEKLPADARVTYGFMWYAADNEDDVKRIVLGRRTVAGSFKATTVDLPKDKDLVVCAYVVQAHDTWDEEVTGEERDFWWSF